MPIHVTTSTTQSLSNKTFVDRLSTTGIVYANGGTSDQWNSVYSNVNTTSGNNSSVYSSVNTTSANWNAAYTITNSKSANWDSVYSSFNTQSASNASVYSTTNSKSANWDSVYSSFNTQSAANAAVYSTVNTSSANWNNVYSTVQTSSGSWGGGGTIDTGVRALTGNWQDTYTQFSTQSANNLSVYSTVQANSGTSTWGFSRIAQVVSVQDATQVSSAITIALNDSIPLSGVGTAYPQLDLSITPTNANSTLLIEVQLAIYVSAAMGVNACLVRDGDANISAIVSQQLINTGHSAQVRLRYFLTAGSTSTQTFRIRFGRTAGTTQTVYLNDYLNTPYYGGTQRSSMTITEIRP